MPVSRSPPRDTWTLLVFVFFVLATFAPAAASSSGLCAQNAVTLSSHGIDVHIDKTIPRHRQRLAQCPRCSAESAAHPALDCSCDAHPSVIKRKNVQLYNVASANAAHDSTKNEHRQQKILAVRKKELHRVLGERKKNTHTLLAEVKTGAKMASTTMATSLFMQCLQRPRAQELKSIYRPGEGRSDINK